MNNFVHFPALLTVCMIYKQKSISANFSETNDKIYADT